MGQEFLHIFLDVGIHILGYELDMGLHTVQLLDYNSGYLRSCSTCLCSCHGTVGNYMSQEFLHIFLDVGSHILGCELGMGLHTVRLLDYNSGYLRNCSTCLCSCHGTVGNYMSQEFLHIFLDVGSDILGCELGMGLHTVLLLC